MSPTYMPVTSKSTKMKSKPPRISISIRLEDAETLQGFVDGGIATSDDEDFSKVMKRILKQLDKKVNKKWALINSLNQTK